MPNLSTPVVEYHEEQPYLAIRLTINMQEIPTLVPPLIGEVANWLEQHHVPQEGPPFFRYLSCTQNGRITVEAGIPVNKVLEGNGRIQAGSFPAGDYLKVTHLGDYSNLREAHMFLESWANRNGLTLDDASHPDGVEWGSRTEIYVNDCELEPDPEKWQTDITLLLAKQA
jgi:effector-binding domain-containing protein